MANEKNLKPFKKGEDIRRNIEGRPTGSRSRSTIVKYWLEVITNTENTLTGKLEDLSIADQITLMQVAKALQSDTVAYKELMDAAYGKLIDTAKIEHSGEINNPVTLTDKQFKDALEALKPK